jgi:tetratricopeptide (TPR) repeat protein
MAHLQKEDYKLC